MARLSRPAPDYAIKVEGNIIHGACQPLYLERVLEALEPFGRILGLVPLFSSCTLKIAAFFSVSLGR